MEKQSLQPNKRQSSTKKVWSAAIIVLAVGITVGSLYWSEGKQKVASPLLSADEKLNNQNQEKIFEPVNQQSENQLKDQPDTGHLSPTNSPSNDVHSSDTKQPENQFTNEVPPQVKDDDQNQGQINSSNSAHSNPNAPATGTKSSDTSDSGVSSTSNDSSTSVTDAEKQGVIAQHRKKLTALKSSCKSSVNNLIGQAKESIKQAQKDGDEDAANSAKKKLLVSVISAEGSCEGTFNEIVANARDEFQERHISTGVIDAWKQEYNETRQDSYNDALEQLKSMFN